MHSVPTNDSQKLKLLSEVVALDIAHEIGELPTEAKAMLMVEISDDILEKLDGFPALMLSNTTTQWLKNLPQLGQLRLIESLALMLMSEVDK